VASEHGGEASGGLSLRGFFLAGIRLAHNRLQILATEIAEEKVRLTLVLLAAVGGLFLLGLAIVLGVVLLAVLYWDSHRVMLLGGLSAFFALLGIALLWATARVLGRREAPFQTTLSELRKDEDAWRAAQDRA
jgi:uncharacterized membrane protein YqjE